IFSPALLATSRFSLSRTLTSIISPSPFIGPQYSFVPGSVVGSIAIGGISRISPPGNAPGSTVQNIFTWSGDLFYTNGRHSLKFGTLINHYQQYMNSPSVPQGSMSFSNLTNFLLAKATTIGAPYANAIVDRTFHFNTLGFYAQDDVRVSSNLM